MARQVTEVVMNTVTRIVATLLFANLVLFSALAPSQIPAQAAAHATNLLDNGSFELSNADPNGRPLGWTTSAWLDNAVFTWDDTQAVNDHKSVKISSLPSLTADGRWEQTVMVQPHTEYLLSGWIKTENVGHTDQLVDAGANLSLYGTWTFTPGLFGTHDWTYVNLPFNSGSSSQVTIAARLGYWAGGTTGTAWFDDLRLQIAPHSVQIDIAPGELPNRINVKSRGVIPVTILTTSTFDATTVDPLSVTFGPHDAAEAHNRGHFEDIDTDGDQDLVLHFRIQETGVQCGMTSVPLSGRTTGGQAITGVDVITTVGCS